MLTTFHINYFNSRMSGPFPNNLTLENGFFFHFSHLILHLVHFLHYSVITLFFKDSVAMPQWIVSILLSAWTNEQGHIVSSRATAQSVSVGFQHVASSIFLSFSRLCCWITCGKRLRALWLLVPGRAPYLVSQHHILVRKVPVASGMECSQRQHLVPHLPGLSFGNTWMVFSFSHLTNGMVTVPTFHKNEFLGST